MPTRAWPRCRSNFPPPTASRRRSVPPASWWSRWRSDPTSRTGSWAVASAGGLDATEFLVAVADAFSTLVASDAMPAMPLHVFAPAPRDAGRPHRDSSGGTAATRARRRRPRVRGRLRTRGSTAPSLSISRGGYNTVAALLRSRVPAVLVPDPSVSDQRPRAEALARFGAVIAVDTGSTVPDAAVLQPAMLRALDAADPDSQFDLDGASVHARSARASRGRRATVGTGAHAVTPAHPAFTFSPVQEELLQAALRRDGQTAVRWAAFRDRYSLEEITQRKARRLLPLVEDGLRCESAPADLRDRSVLRDAYIERGVRA